MVETTTTTPDAETSANGWKRPRGYVSVRTRLVRALKTGATMAQIMGDEHTMSVARLRDGLRIHKTSLAQIRARLDAWEKRGAGRRKPALVAAKRASTGDESAELAAFAAMFKLTPEQRQRVLHYLEAAR